MAITRILLVAFFTILVAVNFTKSSPDSSDEEKNLKKLEQMVQRQILTYIQTFMMKNDRRLQAMIDSARSGKSQNNFYTSSDLAMNDMKPDEFVMERDVNPNVHYSRSPNSWASSFSYPADYQWQNGGFRNFENRYDSGPFQGQSSAKQPYREIKYPTNVNQLISKSPSGSWNERKGYDDVDNMETGSIFTSATPTGFAGMSSLNDNARYITASPDNMFGSFQRGRPMPYSYYFRRPRSNGDILSQQQKIPLETENFVIAGKPAGAFSTSAGVVQKGQIGSNFNLPSGNDISQIRTIQSTNGDTLKLNQIDANKIAAPTGTMANGQFQDISIPQKRNSRKYKVLLLDEEDDDHNVSTIMNSQSEQIVDGGNIQKLGKFLNSQTENPMLKSNTLTLPSTVISTSGQNVPQLRTSTTSDASMAQIPGMPNISAPNTFTGIDSIIGQLPFSMVSDVDGYAKQKPPTSFTQTQGTSSNLVKSISNGGNFVESATRELPSTSLLSYPNDAINKVTTQFVKVIPLTGF